MKNYFGAATAVALFVIVIATFTSYTTTFWSVGEETLKIIVTDADGVAIPNATVELYDQKTGAPTQGPFPSTHPIARGPVLVDERGTLVLEVPEWRVMTETISAPVLKWELDSSGWYEARISAPGYRTTSFRLDTALSRGPTPAIPPAPGAAAGPEWDDDGSIIRLVKLLPEGSID